MKKNNVFTRTRKKLIITITLVVELILIMVSIFIYSYFKIGVYSSVDSSLVDEYNFIRSQFQGKTGNNYELLENPDKISSPVVLQDPKDYVYVIYDNAVKYYTQNRYFGQDSLYKFSGDDMEGITTVDIEGYTFRSLNIKNDKYEFVIMRNVDTEKSNVSSMMVLLLSTDVVALLLVYAIAIFLSKRLIVPLEVTYNNQKKFIQDASHELRTPVAIILSKLESLLKNPDCTVEDEAETIAVAMRETRQLKKMISELLSLTKEESLLKVAYQPVDIEKLLNELSESYIEIADYQEKVFEYNINMKNKVIYSDYQKLRQILRILTDNAFKYTEKGDKISVIAYEKSRDKVVLEVNDTGIGISSKDQKHIFERFFRSDSVRATEIEGSGIGLSIAKVMTSAIGASIKVRSEEGKFTKFIIDIPRGKQSKNNRKSQKNFKN